MRCGLRVQVSHGCEQVASTARHGGDDGGISAFSVFVSAEQVRFWFSSFFATAGLSMPAFDMLAETG